jgi:hypothetical protein
MPNVEVSGLRGFSRRSARLQGWVSSAQTNDSQNKTNNR